MADGKRCRALSMNRDIEAAVAPRSGALERNREAGYGYGVVSAAEAVERAVSGEWDIPEFQRRFVWTPSQVCVLADSLWRNYPIGALLLWRAADNGGQTAQTRWWIADGQQRLTSLCLLWGREPLWLRRMPDELRAALLRRFAIFFDLEAEASPRFVVANTSRPEPIAPRLVPVSRLVTLDPARGPGRSELERLAQELKASRSPRELDSAEIYARLSRVCMMRHRALATTLIRHQREDVLEIFARLNSRGMRFRRLLLKLAMEEIPAAIRGIRGRGGS